MPEKAEIIPLYKKLGETPLECLTRFRREHPAYAQTKMTYLGRLDPMAEGLLPVLAGIEKHGHAFQKDKEKYLAQDKTYEFEVLWGFESDTHDILGLITGTGPTPQKLDFKMLSLLKKIREKKTQSYPIFSSKTFRGNFLSVREAPIEELKISERGIKIFSIEHIHTRLTTGREVLADVTDRIALVKGDFRQKEIEKSWHKVMGKKEEENYLISKFKADVSSGTYIRSLANEMGKILKTSALAYSIKRTRVGEYKI